MLGEVTPRLLMSNCRSLKSAGPASANVIEVSVAFSPVPTSVSAFGSVLVNVVPSIVTDQEMMLFAARVPSVPSVVMVPETLWPF